MSKTEARYLLEWCKSVIDTEKTAVNDFPEQAAAFKHRVRFWCRVQKELKAGIRKVNKKT